MGWKEKYAYRKLRKLVAAQKRTPVIPDLALHSKVGVIWQPSEKPAVQYLRDYFNHHGAIFRDYCLFDSDSNPAAEANSLTVNDLNWWGIPKPEKVNDFIEMELDLLLCLAAEKNYAVDYITALSHAKFKIGSSEADNSYFDLNIKIDQNKDAMFLAEQQIFYLAQLNNRRDS
ncbi:DUF6913 domain-containing protein [Draconibacterium orientale]|jgi:hypothetical protein|uniref:DUF6913 domain-containing protein n=1 Tax=Draconibacterium orientale TaxID=1168034 RepID=UPI002A0A80B4|nr:hypothetical protein [Draconibacterium orientale]